MAKDTMIFALEGTFIVTYATNRHKLTNKIKRYAKRWKQKCQIVSDEYGLRYHLIRSDGSKSVIHTQKL